MLKNMQISRRLLLGFGVVLVLLLVVAGAGYWGLDSVKQETVSMLQGDAQISQFAALIKADTLELRRGEKDSFLNIDNPKAREEYVATWKRWREQLKTQLAEIDKKNLTADDKQTVRKMEENAAAYEGGYSKVLGMIEDGRIKTPQAANAAIAEYKDSIHQLERQATDLSDAHFKIMSSKDQVIADFARRTMILMLIVVIVASIVAVLTAQVIARGVSRPVEAMTTHLAEMAAGGGDLTRRIEVKSNDEVGQMSASLNEFLEKLEKIIIEVKGGAGSISSAAQQVSSTSSSLSQGTSEQAASVEETTSSLEEMSASITQNSDNSRMMEQVFFKRMPITEITVLKIKDFIQWRRKKGDADATIRRQLGNLRSAFTQAKTLDLITDSHIPTFVLPADSKPRKGFLDMPEFNTLREAMPADLRPTLTFLYFSGCRSGAAKKITWAMIDKDCSEITLPGEIIKNDEPLTIPLAGPLEEIAIMLRQMRKSFPKPTDYAFNFRNFRNIWNATFGKLGLGKFDPKTRAYEGLTPHDFRRSAARNLIKAGVDRRVAMKITGHKTEHVFERYNIKTTDDVREALIKVGKYKPAAVSSIG